MFGPVDDSLLISILIVILVGKAQPEDVLLQHHPFIEYGSRNGRGHRHRAAGNCGHVAGTIYAKGWGNNRANTGADKVRSCRSDDIRPQEAISSWATNCSASQAALVQSDTWARSPLAPIPDIRKSRHILIQREILRLSRGGSQSSTVSGEPHV